MKILITGCAGFIGSNLVEELVKRNYEIIVVDNLHTGSLKNLEPIKDRIRFIECSCEQLDSKELSGIDFIFHLGIYSSSPMYREDPGLTGRAVSGFINVFELAKKNNCPVAYASSSSVYNGCNMPYSEDMELKPFDYYTEVRVMFERLAKIYHDLHGVKSIGLRFFSIYGPHERFKENYANLVSQFLWCMQKGESPLIYGDGSQTRDFIYVKDVVKTCLLSMIKLLDNSITYDIINIGTGKSFSLNELVKILNEKLNTDIKPIYKENPISNYMEHTQADITRMKKTLKYEPRITLEKGIEELIGEKDER